MALKINRLSTPDFLYSEPTRKKSKSKFRRSSLMVSSQFGKNEIKRDSSGFRSTRISSTVSEELEKDIGEKVSEELEKDIGEKVQI